jgi:hypothetical protein
MRAVLVILAAAVSAVSMPRALAAAETVVPLPAHEIVIDGDLHEWGQAAWISLDPAGDGVGLRGAFQDDDDHEAVVLVQWDAQALYVAAAVTDDTLDIGRVAPDEREWHGSGGERKDRVFYFDHMKIFAREPGANAGYNLWLAPPGPEDSQPYWWGGRQRTAERVRPPVQVAGLVRGTSRTFEVAIPWTWMEAYPQQGDVFDVMFLFTDADRPGDDVAVKIASKQDRWIWWQGRLELTGLPAGLRPRPAPKSTIPPAPAVVSHQTLDPRIAQAIARSHETAARESLLVDSVAASTSKTDSPTPVARAAPLPSVESAARAASAQGATAASAQESGSGSGSATGSLRARLNRQRLARRDGLRAPSYLRDLKRDPDLSVTQIDTFYAILHRHLARIVEQRITSRIDFFVVDTASGAHCRRDQSRKYLVDLLARVSGAHDEEVAHWIAVAAKNVAIAESAAVQFTREVALKAGEVLAERGITTSGELVKRGRKKSGLTEEQANGLLGALLGL